MSALTTFLLLVVALIGTLAFIADPSSRLMEWANGKKFSELERELKTWIEEPNTALVIGKGCGFVLFILVSLMYTWIIEPLAVIYALVHKVGYQPAAYVIAGIVAISWFEWISTFKSHKLKAIVSITTNTAGPVKRTIEPDEKYRMNMFFYTVRQIFLSLPRLYIWYISLVLIHAG